MPNKFPWSRCAPLRRDELAHAPPPRSYRGESGKWRRPRARTVTALGLAAVAVAGCGTDSPVAASGGLPVTLERVSGDRQVAPPGAELARPLVVRILDAGGRPVRRVEVRWSATSGELRPPVSVTDADGTASATWRLGSEPGEHTATAEADGVEPTRYAATVDPEAPPLADPLHDAPFTTYDGSGQVVHPDYVRTPASWALGAHVLAITPYPYGNASYENPSLYIGNGRDAWRVPGGVENPIVRPAGGHLSDPDLVYLSERGELRLYYRQVFGANDILMISSTDGVRWSAPRLVASARNHMLVSPAVVRRAPDEWLMWSVNSGTAGCGSATTSVELRRSKDGVAWSEPTEVELVQGGGLHPWHIDVQWIPELSQYWAMYNPKTGGSCTTTALYLATSSDGVRWRTYRSPVLTRGQIPAFEDIVYRATFAYDASTDAVAIWHSGARYASRGYEWRAAYERRRRVDLLSAVERVSDPAAFRATMAPPLDNRTAP